MNDQRHDGKTINGQDWTCVCVDSKCGLDCVDCGGGATQRVQVVRVEDGMGLILKRWEILVTIWV